MEEEAQEEGEGEFIVSDQKGMGPAASFLWRGLRLGKKLAIAGAAITTAPVLIPPLIVGLAFAFPFGLYLAGFAYTDKVMRALLSPPVFIEERGEEKKEVEIEIWPPTVIVDDFSVEASEEGRVIDGEEGKAKGHVNSDDEGLSMLVGAAAAKNERVSVEKGQAKVEGDDSDTMTAAHEIEMWPPSNLDISREEGDNMYGTGTGEERHVEELTGRESDSRDEPATDSAEHETEMWPPSNVNISREEVDNMEGTGTGGETDVEELRGRESDNRDEPATVSAKHETEMWLPSNVYMSREEVDNMEGTGTGGERHVEELRGRESDNCDEPATVTAKHEIEIERWPPSNVDVSREEADDMGGKGTGGERHVEELRGRESDNCDEPATVSAEHETEMWPPSNVNISREEVDNMEGTGTGGERHVEELRGRESDNRGEPATVSAEHETEILPPSNVYISREEVDNMEGTGTGGKRHVEELRGRESDNRDEPATVTAEHEIEIEIEMWPPSNLDVSREEVDDMEGTGTGGERHVEELKGRESDNCDEPTTVTSEHELELEEGDNMEGTGTEEERHVEEVSGGELDNCDTAQETKIKYTFSVEGKGDIIQDIGMVEAEKPMQVERGAEECDERGEIEGKENGKGKINEQQDIGISDYPSTVNDHMQIGTVNFEGEEKPMKAMWKVEEKKAEEGKEIQGLATALPEANLYQNNSCSFTEITKESDHEIGQTILTSKHTSTVEKENGTVVKEAKPPEMVLAGRTNGTEDKVQDVPPAALETKEQLPTVHSLTAVPEERAVDFQLPGMSSPHALPPMSNIDGDSTKAVGGGKTMIRIGERKAANEVKVLGQEDIVPTESNYVISTVVSVECKSVVDQSAAKQNKNEGGVETYEPTVASEKAEGGVMEAEYCRSAATSQTVEPLMTVYHSFVAETPLECVSENEPSNLSTDYASAVEDQSSDLTDAECGPTAAVVEIAELVHSGDEVFYREDMIWEQIYAMRTIVGYKAALHSSPVEELKALYLFTGVEPPVSLKDTSDIMEIGDKLKFLKSVIGVK